MSIARGLIRQGTPVILESHVQALAVHEVSKGCCKQLAAAPVALEPPFQPIRSPRDLTDGPAADSWTLDPSVGSEPLARLRVWVSPEQECSWAHSEMLLRQLQNVSRRVILELSGNAAAITLDFRCHEADLPTLTGAFTGAFERCELSRVRDDSTTGPAAERTVFFDYVPPPPYSHLLTRPFELPVSPYATIIGGMSLIPQPATALLQVLFQPVAPDHDWHRNVQVLLDLEYAVKLLGSPLATRVAQQTPSGDLRQMAMDAETKAHDDKPFFAAAVRLAVFDGAQATQYRQALDAFSGLIQHGGRPLGRLDEQDYAARLDAAAAREMFSRGRSYRPGFLVNSAELTSLVHIPPATVLEQREAPVVLLETLRPGTDLAAGSPLGYCECIGRRQPVCIPREHRFSHTHIIGRTGLGKSTVLGHLILNDIEHGDGVAVIDPQGHLVERLLRLMPRRHVERIIYIDFADPECVPIFNPLRSASGRRREQLAQDIVVAFKSFVSGWGDRLEHLLRMTILGLLHLPDTSLLDVANALRTKSTEARQLRDKVLEVVDGELLRAFWRDDLISYARADLTPPQHKLSKLLSGGPLALMLSQPDSLLDLGHIMNDGGILLLNLKDLGVEVGNFAGSLWLSLLQAAASTRDASAPTARPFQIHVDEAHRFETDATQEIATEARKFRVSLTLAHHYLSQFEVKQRDALCSVGTTIIRNVDSKDAAFLCKDLQGRVETHDITTLDRATAIARIGTEVVRFKTLPPQELRGRGQHDEIVRRSRQRYYRPAADVRAAIRNRQQRWHTPFAPLAPAIEPGAPGGADEELSYEVF